MSYSSADISDKELEAIIVDNLPNCELWAKTSEEVTQFIHWIVDPDRKIQESRTASLLFKLMSEGKVINHVPHGITKWYRRQLSGEELYQGTMWAMPEDEDLEAIEKAMSMQAITEDQTEILPSWMLPEEVEKFLSKGVSPEHSRHIDDLDLKSSETANAREPSPKERKASIEKVEAKLKQQLIDTQRTMNHKVKPGTRDGDAPFTFEEVVFWLMRRVSFKFPDMVGIIGASLAIYDDENRVYLFKERPEKVFNMPGGKREEGETPFECLMREVKEEGVIIDPGFIRPTRIPDFISFGVNTENNTYGYNWTWMIPKRLVKFPDHDHKWVKPEVYKPLPEDAAWVNRVMFALKSKGDTVVSGQAFTTWLYVFTFAKDLVYDSVVCMKVPWNNMM